VARVVVVVGALEEVVVEARVVGGASFLSVYRPPEEVVLPAVVEEDVVLPVVVLAPTTSPPQAAATMAASAIRVTVERFMTLCTEPALWLVRVRSMIASTIKSRRESLLADVLIPQFGALSDQSLHHLNAVHAIEDDHLDSSTPHVAFRPLKAAVLAHDDAGNPIEQRGARTHVAGGQGRVQGRTPVNGCGPATGVLKCIHLGVEDWAPLLDPAVVSGADHKAVDDQNRSDGNTPLIPAFARLGHGQIHKVDRAIAHG